MTGKKNSGVLINVFVLVVAVIIAVISFVDYASQNSKEAGFYLPSEANVVIASIQAEGIDDPNDRVENTNTEVEIQTTKPERQQIPIIEEEIDVEPKTTASANNEKVYKYFYYQLDSNAKTIYDAIENNIENLKTGTYSIELPTSVGRILDADGGEELLNEEFQSAWDAIIMDRMDLFFLDVSKVTLEMRTTIYGRYKSYKLTIRPNSTTYLEADFPDKGTINNAMSEIEKAREEYVSKLSGTDYEKVKQLNDMLVDDLEYGLDQGENAYNIYGALIKKDCVCEGYAEAFKYILDYLDIPCILVIRKSTKL